MHKYFRTKIKIINYLRLLFYLYMYMLLFNYITTIIYQLCSVPQYFPDMAPKQNNQTNKKKN